MARQGRWPRKVAAGKRLQGATRKAVARSFRKEVAGYAVSNLIAAINNGTRIAAKQTIAAMNLSGALEQAVIGQLNLISPRLAAREHLCRGRVLIEIVRETP